MASQLAGLEVEVCHIDDILVVGRYQTEHDHGLASVFDWITKSGLIFNSDKWQFSHKRIEYLSQTTDSKGVTKKTTTVKALPNMDKLHNLLCLRFLGMANWLMKFSPNLAENTQSLKKNKQWLDLGLTPGWYIWRAKTELSLEMVMAHYNQNRVTAVLADASGFRLGAVITQI